MIACEEFQGPPAAMHELPPHLPGRNPTQMLERTRAQWGGRGTPHQPGLVFALLPGGACRGVVFRLERGSADAELERLWAREMPTGAYDPRWLPARTAQGEVRALAFTLSRRSEAFVGRIGYGQMLHILRHASGRCGSTLQYLSATADALRERGVHDREAQRLMALTAAYGLI